MSARCQSPAALWVSVRLCRTHTAALGDVGRPISSSRPTTYRRRTAASRCGSAPKESRSSTATGIEAVVARLGQDPPRRTSRAKRAHRSERRRSCEHN